MECHSGCYHSHYLVSASALNSKKFNSILSMPSFCPHACSIEFELQFFSFYRFGVVCCWISNEYTHNSMKSLPAKAKTNIDGEIRYSSAELK